MLTKLASHLSLGHIYVEIGDIFTTVMLVVVVIVILARHIRSGVMIDIVFAMEAFALGHFMLNER